MKRLVLGSLGALLLALTVQACAEGGEGNNNNNGADASTNTVDANGGFPDARASVDARISADANTTTIPDAGSNPLDGIATCAQATDCGAPPACCLNLGDLGLGDLGVGICGVEDAVLGCMPDIGLGGLEDLLGSLGGLGDLGGLGGGLPGFDLDGGLPDLPF